MTSITKSLIFFIIYLINAICFAAARQQRNETIIVTAHRGIETISTVLAPVNIVTREQIDHWQLQSLPDILQRLPGIMIATNGGRGQFATISIRGTNSNQVLVIIDGIRLPAPGILGAIDFSQIPIGLIQRIEYIRGPLAATYGSDAVGGVINIITESQTTDGGLNASYGSLAYQNYNFGKRININSTTTMAVGGGYESTTGYDVHPIANEPDKDGFRSQSLWLGLNHRFNPKLMGFIRGWGFSNMTQYDGSQYAPENKRQLNTRNYDAGLQFVDAGFTAQIVGSIRNYNDINYDESQGQKSGKPIQVVLHSLHWGNRFEVENKLILHSGIDYYQEKLQKNRIFERPSLSRVSKGLYTTAQKAFDSLLVEVAMRLDNNEQYGRYHTWQVAGSWTFMDNYALTLAHGTAFKAPTFHQIFSVPGWGTTGNRELQPEKSRQSEINIEGNYSDINWQLSAYRNNITNLIIYKKGSYKNEAHGLINGLEFYVEFYTGDLEHTLSLEYIDAKNARGHTVPRLPHKQAKYSVDYAIQRWQFNVAYRYLGRRSDSDYSVYPTRQVTLSEVSLFDMAAGYKILPNLWIRGKIKNIFNKNYETAFTYPNPGRELLVTVSYDF